MGSEIANEDDVRNVVSSTDVVGDSLWSWRTKLLQNLDGTLNLKLVSVQPLAKWESLVNFQHWKGLEL